MLDHNLFLIQRIAAQKMNESLRQAEKDRLLSQLSSRRPNLFFQWMRGTLHALAHLLMRIGEHLDQIAVPQEQAPISSVAASK